jgi:hypothetical protein
MSLNYLVTWRASSDTVQDQPSLVQYMTNNGIYGRALMNAPCVRRLWFVPVLGSFLMQCWYDLLNTSYEGGVWKFLPGTIVNYSLVLCLLISSSVQVQVEKIPGYSGCGVIFNIFTDVKTEDVPVMHATTCCTLYFVSLHNSGFQDSQWASVSGLSQK